MRRAYSSSSAASWDVHASSSQAALAAFRACTDIVQHATVRVDSTKTTSCAQVDRCGITECNELTSSNLP
eukprot:6490588-Amphidinium_carterae.2